MNFDVTLPIDNFCFDNEWIKEFKKYSKEHPIEEKKTKGKVQTF